MNKVNTSVDEEINETTDEKVENDTNENLTAEEQKKVSNASHARRRIAEKARRKAMQESNADESELDPEEEAMIAKSRIGKMTETLGNKFEELEGRADADEVAKEVEKIVEKHDYKDHINTQDIIVKALDPKYADLEIDDIIWLSLKDKMAEIYNEKQKEAEKKIINTALPKTIGNTTAKEMANISIADWASNREQYIARLKK